MPGEHTHRWRIHVLTGARRIHDEVRGLDHNLASIG